MAGTPSPTQTPRPTPNHNCNTHPSNNPKTNLNSKTDGNIRDIDIPTFHVRNIDVLKVNLKEQSTFCRSTLQKVSHSGSGPPAVLFFSPPPHSDGSGSHQMAAGSNTIFNPRLQESCVSFLHNTKR